MAGGTTAATGIGSRMRSGTTGTIHASPRKGKLVTHVSGTICHLCPGPLISPVVRPWAVGENPEAVNWLKIQSPQHPYLPLYTEFAFRPGDAEFALFRRVRCRLPVAIRTRKEQDGTIRPAGTRTSRIEGTLSGAGRSAPRKHHPGPLMPRG
jgi:hypothetical protein